VRLRKVKIHRRVNGNLKIEFAKTSLTSYAGLELLIRYFKLINLNNIIRMHLSNIKLSGDYIATSMVRVFVGLIIVGGERLDHISHVVGDPLFMRFSGLAHLPSSRILSRWLKNFTMRMVERLQDINADMVGMMIKKLPIKTLTIDVDGTVLSAGNKVLGTACGYNPKNRNKPSYYPITTHIGETGHMVRVKNRSGNINDGKYSIEFLKALFKQLRNTLDGRYNFNFRMDGAFFKETFISLLLKEKAGYAIKVPFWKWLDLQSLIKECKNWNKVSSDIDCFEEILHLNPWGFDQRVVNYRKKVKHKSRRNYQLDLFDPNNGYYEYSAVSTNLKYDGRNLWKSMCGRGNHEKTIGDLKTNLAFDTIPTNQYESNSAWQQLVVIAYNFITNFQIDNGCEEKSRGRKRTTVYKLKPLSTLRFKIFNKAGQIIRPGGCAVLRLCRNERVGRIFTRIATSIRSKTG